MLTAKAVALASGPEEEVESKPETVDKAVEHPQPAVILEPSAGERGESQTRQQQIVVVKRGDSLSRIIIRAYGSYNGATLSTVLQENPEIENPTRVIRTNAGAS